MGDTDDTRQRSDDGQRATSEIRHKLPKGELTTEQFFSLWCFFNLTYRN